MEPHIQYAKTADGVSIAFCTLGQGAPAVQMPLRPWSHIQAQWRLPVYREVPKSRARDRLLVRYDGRGTGVSDRNVTEFSLEADLLDMEAVVDRLNLETFVLTAASLSSPIAIAYAARHPQRVSRLVLPAAYARAASFLSGAMRSLRDTSWELYTETIAHYVFGLGAEDATPLAARS